MTKALITAIFLSQAPIQDVHVFQHTYTFNIGPTEVINYDPNAFLVPAKRVNTIHIRGAGNRPVVVSTDWYTQKPPIPYSFFWNCPFEGQTAQQCIAIHAMLQQELDDLLGVDPRK